MVKAKQNKAIEDVLCDEKSPLIVANLSNYYVDNAKFADKHNNVIQMHSSVVSFSINLLY